MRRLWRRDEKVDWKPWNQALALTSLVGTPAAIAAAEKMDAMFWHSTLRMEKFGTFDEGQLVRDRSGPAVSSVRWSCEYERVCYRNGCHFWLVMVAPHLSEDHTDLYQEFDFPQLLC
jgi:hypothetical protein